MSTSSKSVVVEFLTKFEKTIVKPVSRRFSWRPEDNNSLVKVISDVFIIPASSTDLPITVTSHSDSVMTIFNDPDKTSDLTVKINGDTNGNNLSYWRAISGALGSLTVTNANVNSQRILKIYTIIPQGSILVNDGTVATATTSNDKVKVSVNDTISSYLVNKIIAGTNISVIETTDGGNETIVINNTAPGGDLIAANNLSDLDNAGTSRTNLGVDPSGTDNSTNVTLAGEDYLSISTQEITANAINLDNLSATGTASGSTFLRGDNTWAAPSSSGDLLASNNLSDVDNVGTSRTNLGLAIGSDVQAYDSVLDGTTASYTTAEETKLSGIETSADVTDTANVTSAGALMDSEVDADIKTLVLPANTTISTFGATLVDDAAASNARTTLDVDQAGTDNSTNVTLAGSLDYLTIVGQAITRGAIDLTTDVTGDLPVAEGGTGSSTAGAARTALGLAIGSDVQAWDAVLDATTASFLTADETKLDGIEALADVTDVTNVTAAGALMDSEVDADIKTLVLPANTTISTFGATLVDDAAATNARTTLGVAIGSDVQAWDAVLDATTASFLTADEIKLDGIEALADVTDATNVAAAGALMDSEVTNLSQVKAFDTTDYATAAQGTTADSAMQDLVDDTTPTLGGELDCGANSVGFTAQTATGDGTTTIDWGVGNKFNFTFGAFNETFTFTAPTKPGNFLLKMIQDGVGSRTATWPATVKWPGGTAPTLTTAASSIDIVSFYFDGTNYYGQAGLAFS